MTRRTSHPAQRPARVPPVPKLRTIEETAELFGTSTRTVRRLIDLGDLPVHRVGRCVRISDADIAVFLAANRTI